MTDIADSPRDTAAAPRPHREKRKWGPILVGIDGSEAAGRAVDAAGALAADLDVELWITYVIDRRSDSEATQFSHVEDTSIGDATETVADSALVEAVGRAEAVGVKKHHAVVRWGRCAEELVAVAGEFGANAIVVGRRGVGGRLSQALLGSVSQKLAGISPINLVIVP